MTPKNKGMIGATVEGIKGRRNATDADFDSIDLKGARCLVTGANGGLGKAIATQLASYGGHVTMAGRTLSEEARQDIIKNSENNGVEMEHLDMASFESVLSFVDRVVESDISFSIVVLNAAVVTKKGFVTQDGLDEMWQVNFFSNLLLIEKLLETNRLRSVQDGVAPRVIFVSSEAHRWSENIDLDQIGLPQEYTMKKAMARYSDSKFMTAAYATHLARKLDGPDGPEISVHALCPGAVNSNLARQAPSALKPILKAIFYLFFASPKKAAKPAVHLACSPTLEERTGVYYHLMTEKSFDERASQKDFGDALFEKAVETINQKCGRQVLKT